MKTNRYLIPFGLCGQLRIRTLSLLCFFLLPLFSFAAVITVPGDYSTIQAAINAANDGDEIVVSAGTYKENIDFLGKNIILRSTDPTDPTVVANTVIDGNQAGSVVNFSGTENGSCILSGFTITNGFTQLGGGIWGSGTLATIQNNNITTNSVYGLQPYGSGGGHAECDGAIQNNTISGNSADYYGGGLYGCNGTIQNNTILDNSAYGGGGLNDCEGTIQNNTISGNSASWGGGLYDCNGIIKNNTISRNSCSDNGGGIDGCNGTIENNTISDNSAHYGGGLAGCDGTIQNNTISGNSASWYGGGLNNCDGIIQNNTIYGNWATTEFGYSYGGGLYQCSGTIQSNTISGNSAKYGGGLHQCGGTIQNNTISGNESTSNGGGLYDCDFTIRNNTIYGNSAGDAGGGLFGCNGYIRNCIVWQNDAPTGVQLSYSVTPLYSCIQDWTGGGTGNISANPQLVDPANGDFHLQPNSPCIDAGGLVADLTNDFEGDARPYDGTSEARGDGSDYDIGADEFIGTAVPTPTPTPTVTPTPTPTPIPPPYTFDFDTGAEGWMFSGKIGPFDPPAQTSSGGHLGLSPAGLSFCFGFWDSPQIEVRNGVTYRAAFSLTSSLSTGELVPMCRLRANQVNGYGSAVRLIISGGDGGGAPVTTPRSYDVLFTPLLSTAEGTVTLSFDIANIGLLDDADAWIYLESVTIEEVSVSP